MAITPIKFIANVNIEKQIVDFLIEAGFDTTWVVNINKRMSDATVCEVANKEQRIVLTNDKDFGGIVFLQKKISHGIILMRVKGQDVVTKIALLQKLLEKYHEKVIKHFVIVTREKFRFIPMEMI